MTPAPEPLWRALRQALDEHGYSVRGFAKACHEASPTASWDSWKRTINRALDDDQDPPYTPSAETAELWAKLLRKPATYFVRQPARTTRLEAALAEAEQLRKENAELRRRLGDDAKSKGGSQ